MTKKQHYMTYNERQKLEALYNTAKMPVAAIAKALGFSRQTIYNELKIGFYNHTFDYYDRQLYSADKAESIHRLAQSGKGRPEKIGKDHTFAQFIEEKILLDRFSPAAALAAARAAGFTTRICTATLYSYIDKRLFLKLSNNDLWIKGSRCKRAAPKEEKRIAHPKLPSIIDRPAPVADRLEPGHWEMDLVIGCKDTHPVLLTMTERTARAELIFRLPDRKASTVRSVFDRLEETLPHFSDVFKTITTDNGSEFLRYDELCSSIHGGQRFDVYYCHSFAAWEKGSNENHNRMIRRWFPKGTDFSQVTDQQILEVQNWMNNYPRKILGWKTPLQVLEELLATA